MCGIAGVMLSDDTAPDTTILDRLEAAIAHRGPDGSGRYVQSNAALLNTRLAIVDLKTGDQPFRLPEGVALVANGEIYNDPEIRAERSEATYVSKSDCESPLHLYRSNGADFVGKLRGMYAIAIYDNPKRRLFLSRDSFGIKPLYYVSTPSFFAFASEPQALIAAGLATNGIDGKKRSELLQLKFTSGRQTIFKNICRVLPGETLVVSEAKIADRRRLNALNFERHSARGDKTALDELDRLLRNSVTAHVRSDVPYGLFLSGGIDSTALLTVMSRLTSQPVAAFTASFPDGGGTDESEAASLAARSVGADHHVVDVDADDLWTQAGRVASALDDPTADAAALPTFKLAACAKEHGIKVVLSGEGADEVFGGYSRYRRARWLFGLLGRSSRTHGVFDDLRTKGEQAAFAHWRDGLSQSEAEVHVKGLSALQRLQAFDCVEWLPNDLLLKLDRCLMWHGVEGRTPYLDAVLSPYALGLSDSLKVRGKFGKWLLRKWLSIHLPSAGAFAKKVGFVPPVGIWIAARKAEIERLLLATPGIAEMAIDDVVRRTMADPARNGQAAWSLLFYALWHSHHVLKVSADGTVADILSDAARRG